MKSIKVKPKKMVRVQEDEKELYECQLCGDMTPDLGICFMCKETTI